MTIVGRQCAPWMGVVAAAILVGALVAFDAQLAFVATLVLLGAAALAAPAPYWAAVALVGALTFRGLVTLGVLPSVATFADIPLAWGALAAALLRTRIRPGARSSRWARRYMWWLAILAAAVVASWAFSGTELVRPVLYLALLAEPFVLIGALVLDPPSPGARKLLVGTALGLLLLQIPIAFWQAISLGLGDHVQGTLYGAGAGHHTISAVVMIGAIWIALMKQPRLLLRYAAVVPLAVIPFLADAKQVVLALPAVLLVGRWRSPGDLALRITAVAGAVTALVLLAPHGQSAVRFIDQTRSGQGGKQQAADVVWSAAKSDPATIVFGQGPAQTVSRAAFMTTDFLLRPDSPLRVFDLRPAEIALRAQAAAEEVSGLGSSFNSGLSSALGVFGDLGVAGLVAYAGLLISVILALRRSRSPEGVAAAAGFAMFAVLGVIFDWWEQPPFSVYLAILAGLALTETFRDGAFRDGARR